MSGKLTFKKIDKEVNKILMMKDKGVMKLLIASVIGNQLSENYPIWMMFVAASSSGKTVLLDSLLDIEKTPGKPLIYSISDMTVNTLASAYRGGEGDGSLLNQMPNLGAIMVFKDFTTMIEKTKDVKGAIMSQLREVYDGRYTKRTGTINIVWKGKIGAIAAVTEMIYDRDETTSAMGDRFIFYDIDQPGRRDIGKRVEDNILFSTTSEHEKVGVLRGNVKKYVESIMQEIYIDDTHKFEVSEDQRENIFNVADLSTMARSGVITDFKGDNITFVPAPEQVGRMLHQLYAIARALSYMNKYDTGDGSLTEADMHILYKVAFASIPKKRRMALQQMTKYSLGVTTKGVAIMIDYPTETVKLWLQELNGLKIISRVNENGIQKWVLKKRFIKIMAQFENIEVLDEAYVPSGDEDADLNDYASDYSVDVDKELKEYGSFDF